MKSTVSKYLTKPIHLTVVPNHRRTSPADGSLEEKFTIICEMDYGEIKFPIVRRLSANGVASPLRLSEETVDGIARQIPGLKRLSKSASEIILLWATERIKECNFEVNSPIL